jgi:hypothetical protein
MRAGSMKGRDFAGLSRRAGGESVMPATRSRTDNWRRSLEQILERNGALEITLPRLFEGGGDGGEQDGVWRNLVWRVRILSLSDAQIVVEQPTAMGEPINLRDGVDLVAVMPIGQNRWMFHTRVLGSTRVTLAGGRQTASAVRLAMPTTVERCQRRSFYRISTVGLLMPTVTCRPLLDIATAEAAEVANRTRIQMLTEGGLAGAVGPGERTLLPEAGPAFRASLVNIGGGGAGLMVEPEEAGGMRAHRHFWLEVSLEPHVPAPIGVVGRLAHTHIDSSQRVYAGLAFEFAGGPTHKAFVTDLLCKYVNDLQREQLQRRSERESA